VEPVREELNPLGTPVEIPSSSNNEIIDEAPLEADGWATDP